MNPLQKPFDYDNSACSRSYIGGRTVLFHVRLSHANLGNVKNPRIFPSLNLPLATSARDIRFNQTPIPVISS